MNQRGAIIGRRDPGRFRCLVCKRVVTGTPTGHCPRCGFVPPSAPSVPEEPAPIAGVGLVGALALVMAILVVLLR